MKNKIDTLPEIKMQLSDEMVIETRSNGTVRQFTKLQGPDQTQQQFKDETDVNHIMKKYRQTGQITHLARKQGIYRDIADSPDYQTAMETVVRAQEGFMTLPSDLRERFGNDPARLYDFLNDPKNIEEGIKLGLYEKREQHEPAPAKNDQTKTPKAENVKNANNEKTDK